MSEYSNDCEPIYLCDPEIRDLIGAEESERWMTATRNHHPDILRYLARDASLVVLVAVAANPEAPVDVQRFLHAKDTPVLDAALLANPSCPPDLVCRLAFGSRGAHLAWYAQSHPAFALATRNEHSAAWEAVYETSHATAGPPAADPLRGIDQDKLLALAQNPHTPAHVLTALAKSGPDSVLPALATNPALPTACVLRLAYGGPSAQIRESAHRHTSFRRASEDMHVEATLAYGGEPGPDAPPF